MFAGQMKLHFKSDQTTSQDTITSKRITTREYNFNRKPHINNEFGLQQAMFDT